MMEGYWVSLNFTFTKSVIHRTWTLPTKADTTSQVLWINGRRGSFPNLKMTVVPAGAERRNR